MIKNSRKEELNLRVLSIIFHTFERKFLVRYYHGSNITFNIEQITEYKLDFLRSIHSEVRVYI